MADETYFIIGMIAQLLATVFIYFVGSGINGSALIGQAIGIGLVAIIIMLWKSR